MCREQYPTTAVIMVTGHGSVETAVEAMRLGAFDDPTKPFDLGDLIKTVNQALASNGAGAAGTAATATNAALPSSILRSAALLQNSSVIAMPSSAFLTSCVESRTTIAPFCWKVSSERVSTWSLVPCMRPAAAPKPPLLRNCNAPPCQAALETELFGSMPTFRELLVSTVHLAEINQLPARIQAHLNTFLDETMVRKTWSSGSSDYRLVVSSTSSLEEAVTAGKFREDLDDKLSVVPLKIPALRERREDIKPLVEHMLKDLAERTESKAKTIDQNAIEFLEKYTWPGNVSELRNAIERACAFAENDRVRPSDLPTKVTQQIEVPTPSVSEGITKLPIGSKLDDFVKNQERIFIQETLRYNNGSREKTASRSASPSPRFIAKWGSTSSARPLPEWIWLVNTAQISKLTFA